MHDYAVIDAQVKVAVVEVNNLSCGSDFNSTSIFSMSIVFFDAQDCIFDWTLYSDPLLTQELDT